MKEMRRILALVLCLVMLVGILPVSALRVEAAGTVVDAAVMFSDLHTSSSDYKEDEIVDVMGGVASSGLSFSSVTSVGDAFSSDYYAYTGYTSYITEDIRTGLSDSDVPVYYAWSDHDRGADIENVTGLLYGDDSTNYYIYAISMADMCTTDRYRSGFSSSSEVAQEIAEFTSDVAAMDKTKPLFIVSHVPMHARRSDNGYAYQWYQAISAAAEEMDIAFFWGHNHTSETDVDRNAYYVPNDGSESLSIQDTSTTVSVKPNFTYICAGYMNESVYNASSTRENTVIAIAIYEDSISYVTYDADGVYSDSYALNETVTRDHASAEDTEEETTEPTTEATEPTTEPTTSTDVELSDAATGVIVKAPGLTALTVSTEVADAALEAASENLTGNVVAYDIKVEGFATGDTAKVTMPIPADVTNPVVYYVSDDGATVENMHATKGNGVVTFNTTHFSVYAVGEGTMDAETENKVTTGGTTYEDKTVYVKVDSFEDGEKYLLIGEDGPTNGNPIALVNSNGSDTYAAVTVNSGSITADGVTYSDGYIELSNSNAVFTASGSDSSGYTLKNGNYYIGGTGSTTLYTSSSSAVKVTYDADAVRLHTASGTTRYLYYSTYGSETWKWSTSSSSTSSSRAMYIYKEVTAQIPTSNEVTYTMQASDLAYILPESGDMTAQLEYALLGNGSALATLPSGGAYTFDVFNTSDPSIISECDSDGTLTFTGEEGSAKVKVSYTWTDDAGTHTVYKYVTVTATKPFYALEITAEADGSVIKGTQSVKGVEAGTTRDYSAKLLLNGVTETTLDLTKVTWASSNESIATVDSNGLVTFTGSEGTVQITATYENGDTILTDTISIYVTKSIYYNPAEGTDDFPEYPHEGAIRFDKTAEAVGNFSDTGVAKVELSMTGVPYTTGNRMDVVLMLDRSSSMTDTRIAATRAAAKVFVKNIVINEDGSFNNNRIYIGDFLGGNPEYAGQSAHEFKINSYTRSEEDGYQIINSQEELDELLADIDAGFVKQGSAYGTEYAQSLEYCYNLLNATKDDGNKQFCVFMSDGIPNVYQYSATEKYESTGDMAEMFTGTNYNERSDNYHYEYYSGLMKGNGVTVFTVGLGLNSTNSAWDGVSATACLNAASLLLNDISGPAGEAAHDTGTTISKKDEYFFSVEDADAAAGMANVFSAIAQKILDAATNVVVTDKIADEYTMIFDIPQGAYDDQNTAVDTALADQEFYIEFLEYALDENHERTTSTSKLKLYLGVKNNTYYAASDASGTEFADPVFTEKTGDSKAYWSVVDSAYTAAAGEIVINVNGTLYKFMEKGDGTHNMTSGAYASGSIDATTKMSTDLVIVTPYFAYSAATRMLAWTVEKLTTVEYALTYFLYLDNSATDIGESTETAEGPYETNDYAYITYTNFNGNDCRQEFPVPQLTWNGAQVSYVFYLVNSSGQPINKSGQVVDFANATFVTDVYTRHITWNALDTPTTGSDAEMEGVAYLDATYEAESLLSSDYTLYDAEANYELLVYEDHEGNVLNNYFKISGGEANGTASSTTKVYNTKAGTKYSAYATYYPEDAENVDTSAGTVVYVEDTFDFANTTVAFAVLWKPALVPDTVVLDYGLDVLIDVVRNDLLQNVIGGISETQTAYNGITMNTGVSTTSKFSAENLTIDGNTISIEDENRIRFHQTDMEFQDPVTFYYESPVSFYESSDEKNGYLYSSVTVIPATTVYYEDSFLTLNASGTNWVVDGTETTATQDQDRPGESQISTAIDADNVYGYDSAYTSCSKYSLGSAAKVHVDANSYATASFTFYGTGFDVIGLTSNTTGTLLVSITNTTTEEVKNLFVDTYYGYSYSEAEGWHVDANNPNALYQVPVIKATNLEYGHYNVEIRASYNSFFDHTTPDGYDLYLDAIRIYDPTGNQDSDANEAYVADGEGWPTYIELRNNVITAETFNNGNTEANGLIFIDGSTTDPDREVSIADYTSYGPNNELYLAAGQSIAFKLDQTQNVADVQIGLKSADGNAVTYKIYNANTTTAAAATAKTVNTATDMYYSIKNLASGTIVITNTGSSGILSVTNIKTTYTQDPYGTNGISLLMDDESAGIALMSLRSTPVVEEEVPETTVPETTVPEETETETTVPEETETETTTPEETEPETSAPEETEPETEETKPSKPGKPDKEDKPNRNEEMHKQLKKAAEKIKNFVTSLLGKWFR